MDIFKILYLIFLVLFLYYLTVRIFIMKKSLGRREWFITLLVLGFSLVFYIRFIIHDLVLVEPSDEAMYVSLIKEVSNGMDPPASGPGFVYLILLIKRIFGWPVDIITGVLGLIVGSLYLLLLYQVYKVNLSSRETAVYSCLMILSTSYFLWPMIESRPQQLGMLLVLVGAYFYHAHLGNGRYLGLLITITIFTFVFHILSFLFLISIMLILWWLGFIENKTRLKQGIWPGLVLISGLLIFFSPLPLYSSMNGGVGWMLRRSELGFLQNSPILVVLFAISILFLVALTIYLKNIKVPEGLMSFGGKHIGKLCPIIIIATILVLFVQFMINRDVYSSKYRGSILLFIVFQMGNIVFGGLFIRSFLKSMRNGDFEDPFFRIVSILMFMGIATLLISIFLPMNFNNWMIRTVNYWTVFAAPLVAREVMDMPSKWRNLLVMFLPILIILSLINISRDQTIFGYP